MSNMVVQLYDKPYESNISMGMVLDTEHSIPDPKHLNDSNKKLYIYANIINYVYSSSSNKEYNKIIGKILNKKGKIII